MNGLRRTLRNRTKPKNEWGRGLCIFAFSALRALRVLEGSVFQDGVEMAAALLDRGRQRLQAAAAEFPSTQVDLRSTDDYLFLASFFPHNCVLSPICLSVTTEREQFSFCP